MNSLFGNWASTLKRYYSLLVLSILLSTLSFNYPAIAAERIYASYSALELSVPVAILENYARTGIINSSWGFYQKYFPVQQMQQLRDILLKPMKISPVIATQLLNTQQGEFLLGRLAELITTKSRQPKSGLQALKSAFILAAAEPEGLTLLNLLRKYPHESIHIDLAQSLEIASELDKLIHATQQAIALVIHQSNLEATKVQLEEFSQLPDLQIPGKFSQQKYTIKFFDRIRDRLLLTDIYIPNVQKPAPVIVVSHGLGLDSSNFRYLAKHLASHGFAVVVPNHPGSDTKQLQSIFNTSNGKIAAPGEFTDRPLDIKFILNQLEKSNRSDRRFQNRLNLQQVGVFGQSFGGYTALALAGAKINFSQLAKDCQPQALHNTWNMSLLLQCQALELKAQEYDLRDERVKAAMAVNPIISSIFGKEGLSQVQTPVMVVGSSEDTVAPILYEQILPFSWFTNPQKYLALLIGGTHFSAIGNSSPSSQQVALPKEMIGDAAQARHYINTLSSSFFQAYTAQNAEYLTYLSAAYTQRISNQSLGLSLVQSLNRKELLSISGNQGQKTTLVKKNFLPYWLKWVIGCLILVYLQ